MPQIQLISANRQAATPNLPVPPTEAFGSEAGKGLANFGETLVKIDTKLQAEQDEVDLVGKAGDYNIRLAQLPDEILANPNIAPQDRVAAYKAEADAYREVLSEDASKHVKRALSIHTTQALATGIIHMEAKNREHQIQQLRADGITLQNTLAEKEAIQIASGDGEGALQSRTTRTEKLARSVERGIYNPEEARIENDRTQNQVWTSVAQKNPDYILHLQEEMAGGKNPPAGMDASKIHTYANIAINTINANSYLADREAKRLEALRKAESDAIRKENVVRMYNGQDLGPELSNPQNNKSFTEADLAAQFALNHSIKQNMKQERTAQQLDNSQQVGEGLLHLAHKLYFDESLLSTINVDTVHQAVRKGVLLPEHAAPILNKIDEALKHFASEAGPKKQAEKNGLNIVKDIFKIPPTLDAKDAFELQRLQESAEQEYMTRLEINKQDPVGAGQEVAAQFIPRVLQVQKATLDSLDRQLLTEELAQVGHYGVTAKDQLYSDTHEMKPGPRKDLETAYPMLKGIFRQHDAKVQRYNQLKGMAQQKTQVETPNAR